MFLGVNTLWLQPILNVKEGEVSGLLASIDWMHELEFNKVIFTLDSKSVVDSLNLPANNITDVYSILYRCYNTLNHRFVLLCRFFRRESNMFAPNLAKVTIYNVNFNFILTFPVVLII